MFRRLKKFVKAAVAGAVIGIAARKLNNRINGNNNDKRR